MPVGGWRAAPSGVASSRLGVLAAATLVAASVTGCAPKPLTLPGGASRPFGDTGRLVRESLGHCDTLKSLTAEVGLSGRAGRQRLRGRLLVGLAAPDAVRLEAVAPFGAPFFLLAGQDGTATLLFPREDHVLRDAPVEDILGALAGIEVPASDLRAWLGGCPAGAGTVDEARAYNGGWAAADLAEGRTAWFRQSENAWRLVAVSTPEMTIELSEHAGVQPARVRLRRAASPNRSALDVRLALSQVETNVALPANAFVLDVPGDAVAITLEDLRESGPLRGER